MIAVSADQPSRIQPTVEKHELGYTLYSDSRMNASEAYGIAFKVDEATIARYQGFGIDLEAASGESHLHLPVPSVFIYREGVMTFQYVNPDHRIRLDGDTLLAAARAAAAG